MMMMMISHHFRVIAGSNSHFREGGVPLFNTLVRGEPLNSRPLSFPQETRNIALSCSAKYISISWII